MDSDLDRKLSIAANILSGKVFVLVWEEELNKIIEREFSDRFERALTSVAGELAAVASRVVGRSVGAQLDWYSFGEDGLVVKSRYRLFDREAQTGGYASLSGWIGVDDDGGFHLAFDTVRVELYGTDTDKRIERAAADRLSDLWLYLFSVTEVVVVVAGKYGDTVYEALRMYEDHVRVAVSIGLDTGIDDVSARLFDVEINPEAMHVRVHFLFRARDARTGVEVLGRVTLSGEISYLEGALQFRPEAVDVKYRVAE